MKVEKMLPEVYYKESRDFAYIGRLLEIIFNYMKTASDCVNMHPDNENIDANVVDLLVDTLGFDSKHTYITKDLIFIASSFSELLRKKGTVDAINLAIRLLLNSQGVKKSADFNFVENSALSELEIKIPDELTDIVLLEDIFDYILPAGMTYTITKLKSGSGIRESNIKISNEFKVKTNIPDFTYGYINSIKTPISDEDLTSDDLSERNSGYIGTINTGRVINDIDINSQNKTNT